jgi:hypothetical protein
MFIQETNPAPLICSRVIKKGKTEKDTEQKRKTDKDPENKREKTKKVINVIT